LKLLASSADDHEGARISQRATSRAQFSELRLSGATVGNQTEIFEVGSPAVLPGLHVVGVQKPGATAAGGLAAPVTQVQGA